MVAFWLCSCWLGEILQDGLFFIPKPACDAVQVPKLDERALVLLGSALRAISQKRRKVALAKVNPKLRSLASEDYSKRGTNPLQGTPFQLVNNNLVSLGTIHLHRWDMILSAGRQGQGAVGVVPLPGDNTFCRTPPRGVEHNSRRSVKVAHKLSRVEAGPKRLQTGSPVPGSSRGGPLCEKA